MYSYTYFSYTMNQSYLLLYVCVCVHVYVVYEDTHLYNDMGMTGITREGDLLRTFPVSP